MTYQPLACTPRSLPTDQIVAAARTAVQHNPANALPPVARAPGGEPLAIGKIAIMTSRYWGAGGVDKSVSFLDVANADLRARILTHMNAWATTANVRFRETAGVGDVRIATVPGDGHWSYVGTDITHIAPDRPTMNLDSFTMAMPESEFVRVVRHETGHTLGCPHEHMRPDLVAEIDPQQAILYYGRTQGWSPDEVRAQVLTPLDPEDLRATATSDACSIMCYQVPGVLTYSGQPILGGVDIDAQDYAFMAMMYPRPRVAAAVPASPPAAAGSAPAPVEPIMVHLPNAISIAVPPHASVEQAQRLIAALHR